MLKICDGQIRETCTHFEDKYTVLSLSIDKSSSTTSQTKKNSWWPSSNDKKSMNKTQSCCNLALVINAHKRKIIVSYTIVYYMIVITRQGVRKSTKNCNKYNITIFSGFYYEIFYEVWHIISKGESM